MPFSFLVSVYAFGAVFLFLGVTWVLIRFLVRGRGKDGFDDLSHAPRERGCVEHHDQFERRAARESLTPPSLPTNEFEFYQAGQDAMDRNLPPLASPPPRREREIW